MSFLGLYRDPVVAAVTRQCDWRIADLVDGAHPVSLYLVVPPSDISRTKPLIRLDLHQIGRRLSEDLKSKDGSDSMRREGRRVGHARVSTSEYMWWQYKYKKQPNGESPQMTSTR